MVLVLQTGDQVCWASRFMLNIWFGLLCRRFQKASWDARLQNNGLPLGSNTGQDRRYNFFYIRATKHIYCSTAGKDKWDLINKSRMVFIATLFTIQLFISFCKLKIRKQTQPDLCACVTLVKLCWSGIRNNGPQGLQRIWITALICQIRCYFLMLHSHKEVFTPDLLWYLF